MHSLPISRWHGGLVLGAVLFVLAAAAGTRAAVAPPQPYGAIPTERQLRWHELEAVAFVHFTINTFTDKEWGYGDESPAQFNPSEFDADQIVRAAKDAGLRGLILTAKHHDGFCLWPSQFTEHSIKHSPYRDGKGDLVREFSDACRRHGLAFGIYLSPWDRNHQDYGRPEYITYYRNQLRELLTNYGPIFEVWFDGANGGDGYYGGAREKRNIDRLTYYDWPNTWKIVRELQPNAVMFGDGGPDVRWVGNERGTAGDPCWATIDAKDFYPGHADVKLLPLGTRDGSQWIPAEADVSIRPGWFFHEKENAHVKTVADLTRIYFETVGRGAGLNLNLPPDRRGRLHENDVQALRDWGARQRETFAHNLAADAKVTATNTRGNAKEFSPQQLLDGNRQTYWATDDATRTAEVVFNLARETSFNVVRLREYLPVGQRIDDFAIDVWQDNAWREIAKATAIGSQRLIKTEPQRTTKVRLRILAARAAIALAEFGLFSLRE
jgi:alpha-L-fucosidase